MAYKGRGSGGMRRTYSSSSVGGFGHSSRHFGFGIHVGPRVYMFRDYSQYLMSQVISCVIIGIIILISVLICVFSYESLYIHDPIAYAKSNFLDLQFGGFAVSIILLIFALTKRKTSKHAFKLISGTIFALIAIVLITMLGFFNFENEYNEEKFSEMYSESYIKDETILNKKEVFLQECNKLQESFSRKVIGITILEYGIILVDIYLLFTELSLQKRYAQIEKENEVLFDEEENVKI